VKNSTPEGRPATRLSRLRERVARWIFREPDLDALARGWEVHQPTPFRRVYRDPRWHSIVACTDCGGTGLDGAHECPVCDGRGTLRLAEADASVDETVDARVDAAVVR
jgi:hypothetical protein